MTEIENRKNNKAKENDVENDVGDVYDGDVEAQSMSARGVDVLVVESRHRNTLHHRTSLVAQTACRYAVSAVVLEADGETSAGSYTDCFALEDMVRMFAGIEALASVLVVLLQAVDKVLERGNRSIVLDSTSLVDLSVVGTVNLAVHSVRILEKEERAGIVVADLYLQDMHVAAEVYRNYSLSYSRIVLPYCSLVLLLSV